MTAIHADRLDHVHVEVANRQAAADWFGRVLGLVPADAMAVWAEDAKGPLFLQSRSGQNCLALFQRDRAGPGAGDHTVAFRIGGEGFMAFVRRLSEIEITGTRGRRLAPADVVDHALSWSLYFLDPDGNRFELTTYDHAHVEKRLAAARSGSS